MNGALVELLAGNDSAIELDEAALELARIEHPDLDSGACMAQLDAHAFAIAERTPDLSDGQSFITAASAYLFGIAGFRGNADDYYNPDNSFLNRVLETKMGIPITLSVVYIEVARRLAKPVAGVGLPGHFLIRYDDRKYSAIVDPFHDGAIRDREQCRQLAQLDVLDDEWLRPVDRRHIVLRMLNNLRGIYFTKGDSGKALQVLDLLIAADPQSADQRKQRAVALLRERRAGEAVLEFNKYLELAPEAPDREEVEQQIRNIAFWRASRN